MRHCLYKLLAVLPRSWELVYGGEDLRLVGVKEPEFARNQKTVALREALCAEMRSKDVPRGLYDLGRQAGLIVHLQVDPSSHDWLTLYNCLNNNGPLLTTLMRDKYHLTPSRRLSVWLGEWSDPRRRPALRWFGTNTELEKYYTSIPRLLTKRGDVFRPDLHTLPRLGDTVHEETMWWGVRPRYSSHELEFRYFDSVEPARAVDIVSELLSHADNIRCGHLPRHLTQSEWLSLIEGPGGFRPERLAEATI